MTIKIPDNYMGKPVKGSLERVLTAAPVVADPNPAIQPLSAPTPANIRDPQNYIILPSKTHANYSYPDLLVAMDRTHQGKDWIGCQIALDQEGASMINIRQFADFLNLLKSGRVFDGNGQLVAQSKVESILDEILTVRSTWRSEWLDAKFESRGGFAGMGSTLYMLTNHTIKNGRLNSGLEVNLVDYLASNKTPGIDMDDWLKNANEYGLPKPHVKDGNLYYWKPTNGKVAGFDADSDWAGLSCGRSPSFANASLGVRAARKKI